MAALEETVTTPKVVKVSMNSLRRDYHLYPRQTVDPMTIERFKDAMKAGAIFPPLQVCEATGRIIDGFHRYMAYSELNYDFVDVIGAEVKDDADFFLRAVEANKTHGIGYTGADHEKIAKLCSLLKLEREKVAFAMAIPVQKLESLLRMTPKAGSVPEKIGTRFRESRAGQHKMDEPPRDSQPPRTSPVGYFFFINQTIQFLLSDACNLSKQEVSMKVRDLGEALQKRTNPEGKQLTPLVLPEPVKEWLIKRAEREKKTLVNLVVELLTLNVETDIQSKRDAGLMSKKDGDEWTRKLKPYSVKKMESSRT